MARHNLRLIRNQPRNRMRYIPLRSQNHIGYTHPRHTAYDARQNSAGNVVNFVFCRDAPHFFGILSRDFYILFRDPRQCMLIINYFAACYHFKNIFAFANPRALGEFSGYILFALK